MRNTINRIIATLNGVEVKGKDNLDRLLGSIQALELLRDSMKEDTNGGQKNQ